MDNITKLKRRCNHLQSKLDLITQKLIHVCQSHDHLATKLQQSGVHTTKYDSAIMSTTSQIVSANTIEEVETIYSDFQNLVSGNPIPISFAADEIREEVKEESSEQELDTISFIAKIISELTKGIKNLHKDEFDLWGSKDSDDDDDDTDKTDTLKPPF